MNEEIQIDAVNKLNCLLIKNLIDLMNQCVQMLKTFTNP